LFFQISDNYKLLILVPFRIQPFINYMMIYEFISLQASQPELFGVQIIEVQDFVELVVRFCFNMMVIGLIVRGLYYPVTRRKDYLFSYILISVLVFLLCFLLENVKLQIGFALGLFAIFGIIRYRTNPIPIKEMTYLFVVIGVSVINALANTQVSYMELIFTNLAVIALIFLLEKIWLLKHETSKTIEYEKIDLIRPDRRNDLINDLKIRTGLDIHRIEIGQINFLRDTVRIKIFYMEDDAGEEENIITRSSDNDDDD
jgi:hypothetical protein